MSHRIFSGIQPSGVLHIGNYLGSIQNWVKLQDENECIFSIVDLHAITVPQDPAILRQRVIEVAAMYLACGIDPKKNILFVQSEVRQHTELAWILNTITKISELKLMHQFKEKSKGDTENIEMGLFDYPVLMAADILLYKTNLVPVGEDQRQHLELTRELARRFNARFGDTFVVPEGYKTEMGARIMGLDDPEKKMSKSASSANNYIALTDTPDMIRDKIGRAVTDSGRDIVMAEDRPGLANLLDIYRLMSGLPLTEIEEMYQGKGYKEFKAGLAEVVIDHLAPIQTSYTEWMARPDELQTILAEGASDARNIAEDTMVYVRRSVGLGM